MKSSLVCFISLFTLTFSVFINGGLIEETLESIRYLLDYYDTKVQEMILDGVFGLNYFQGQFLALESFAKRNNSRLLRDEGFLLMEELASRTSKLSKIGLEHIQRRDKQYVQEVGWLIANPFTHADFLPKQVSPKPIKEPVLWFYEDDMEKKVDKCINDVTRNAPTYVEMLREPSKHTSHCHISNNCLQLIFNLHTGSYLLTHQILLIRIYEVVGCMQVFAERLLSWTRKTPSQLLQQLCSISFHETSKYLQHHNHSFLEELEDLFSEEFFICPGYGYYEFLHADWLKHLMRKQLPSGCFSDSYLMENVTVGRRLLKERVLDDSCLAHKTSVVFCAFTQFLTTMLLARSGHIVFKGFEGTDLVNLLPQINYIKSPHLLPAKLKLDQEGTTDHPSSNIIIIVAICFILVVVFFIIFKRRFFKSVRLLLRLCWYGY